MGYPVRDLLRKSINKIKVCERGNHRMCHWHRLDVEKPFICKAKDGHLLGEFKTLEEACQFAKDSDMPDKPKPSTPKKLKIMKFGDMEVGTHFMETHSDASYGCDQPRCFIKLQHTLPSGLKQTHRRIVPAQPGAEKEWSDEFNAIDYKGTAARCPDYIPFIVLEKPKPKPLSE